MTDRTKVFHGDCMEFMKDYPDKHFDLTIADPPYNIVSQQKRGIGSRIDATGKMNDWNHRKPDPEMFAEMFRVSRHVVIWGANNFELPPTEYFLIWDKDQTVDNFASAEYAWTNYPMPAKIYRYTIHKHNATKGEKIHPTMKPVDLYRWILKHYTEDGYKILDPMMGSQSSRIAAFDMGFEYVGFELDKDYFDAGCKRFEQHKQQLKLF